MVSEIETVDINVLPVNKELGFPQKNRLYFEGYYYNVAYRYSVVFGWLHVKIVRVADNRVMLNSIVREGTMYPARDPVTGIPWFFIFGFNVTREDLEIAIRGWTGLS